MTHPLDAYDLSGRVAVVTGAASGIGAGACDFLAAAGAVIVAGDIDEAGLAKTVERVRDAGGTASALATDVTRRAAVDALVAQAVSLHGRLDVLCNVAGAMFPGQVEDLDDATIERGLDLNLKSVIYGCQAAVRAMKPRRSGSIINVSSGAIDKAVPGIGLYALTKAAVTMLTMTLATEVGPFGIRVNAIAPGATLTPFTTWRIHREDGSVDTTEYEAFLARMREMSPLGSVGEVSDQAHLILYLASDASRWVTGNVHRANGGQTMVW